MRSALIAVGVVVLLALMWWQGRTVDLIPDLQPQAGTDDRSAPSRPGAAGADPDAEGRGGERVAVDARANGESATAPVTDAPPDPVATPLRMLVVDGTGDPVADAEVTVFEADGGHRGLSLWVALTDPVGRAELEITAPVLVSAKKAGAGWSGDVAVDPARRQADELRIVLLPTATVAGRVRLPDGTPGVGIRVRGRAAQHDGERSRHLTPVTTDADGAFAFEVLAGLDYELGAQWEGRRSVGGRVAGLEPGERAEVTLRFPGEFSVRGTLLDGGGAPLTGEVRLIRREASGPPETLRLRCDAEGRFERLLAAGGTFDVVGGAEGRTSAHTSLTLDEVRPHQEITLRTSPFVEASGSVVGERGEPLPGVPVGIGYAVERDAVHVQRSALHGNMPRGTTGEDGSFRFEVPDGYRCQVVARAVPGNRELLVRGPIFVAPARGLVVTVREADKQGFVMSGRVVAAADGAPVAAGRISRIRFGENGGASSGSIGKVVDGAFEIGPIAAGQRCSFEFTADGFAPAIVGPYDTTVRHERITVRLSAPGRLRCRVTRPDGTPAAHVFASLVRDDRGPFERSWQGRTDAEGSIEFTEVIPGPCKVHARADAESGGSAVAAATVVAGRTSEVNLVLQN